MIRVPENDREIEYSGRRGLVSEAIEFYRTNPEEIDREIQCIGRGIRKKLEEEGQTEVLETMRGYAERLIEAGASESGDSDEVKIANILSHKGVRFWELTGETKQERSERLRKEASVIDLEEFMNGLDISSGDNDGYQR